MDTVDAFPYADKAVSYKYEAEEIEQPVFDRETEHKLVTAEVMKNLGEEDERKLHPIMWIILIMVLFQVILSFFQFWNTAIGR